MRVKSIIDVIVGIDYYLIVKCVRKCYRLEFWYEKFCAYAQNCLPWLHIVMWLVWLNVLVMMVC